VNELEESMDCSQGNAKPRKNTPPASGMGTSREGGGGSAEECTGENDYRMLCQGFSRGGFQTGKEKSSMMEEESLQSARGGLLMNQYKKGQVEFQWGSKRSRRG